MTKQMYHPTADRLEAFVEGVLERAESVVVESHVLGCSRCQTEVEEVRSLFTTLASLPRFEPAVGFANRIMLQVRLPDPWYMRAGALARKFAPKSKRGWAFAGGMFALPVVSFATLLLWLVSKPYVTGENLLAYALTVVASGTTAMASQVFGVLLHSNLTLWFARGIELLFGAGLRGAGAVAALFAGLTLLSAWVLYQNLFRTPRRGSDHVSYSF